MQVNKSERITIAFYCVYFIVVYVISSQMYCSSSINKDLEWCISGIENIYHNTLLDTMHK